MLGLDLQTIDFKVDSRVAWITLNRPEALNAWTPELGRELISALDHAGRDSDIRAVVLTGAGRAFSSGADLKAIGDPADAGPADVLATLRDIYNPLLIRVREMPKPVVAAVNGGAVGIGCSLALAADLIVAAESAYFLLAFANIGLSIDGGASASLVARIGHARASEMALLAERIPASQAREWGLINRVAARRRTAVDGRRDRGAAGGRAARVLRDDQAHPECRSGPGVCRDARPGGRAAAGPSSVGRLHRRRQRVPPEAAGELHRDLRRG